MKRINYLVWTILVIVSILFTSVISSNTIVSPPKPQSKPPPPRIPRLTKNGQKIENQMGGKGKLLWQIRKDTVDHMKTSLGKAGEQMRQSNERMEELQTKMQQKGRKPNSFMGKVRSQIYGTAENKWKKEKTKFDKNNEFVADALHDSRVLRLQTYINEKEKASIDRAAKEAVQFAYGKKSNEHTSPDSSISHSSKGSQLFSRSRSSSSSGSISGSSNGN